MSTPDSTPDKPVLSRSASRDRALTAVISMAAICWMGMAIGSLGLKILMQERPQFAGQPMRLSKTELIQDAPHTVMRKQSDDLSVIKPVTPESTDVHFDFAGRRDYRGLRTILDMSGTFRGEYLLTNTLDETIFLLFKCPHPRAASGEDQGLLASALKFQTSVPGLHENTDNAWLWSGALAGHGSVAIALSYQVSSLKAATYRVQDSAGNAIKHLRISLRRQDLHALEVESADGIIPAPNETVVWERNDFLAPDFFSARIAEGRSLFTSLEHLLEIGPLVSLLFLVTILAVILARQPLTALQVLTISAGFALYFPLILYLSSRFTFPIALIIAVLVPGALLVNYARWLLGARTGLLGGIVFLGLYQVFPTLAAFAGWNRGMVLLCLGVVTLWVLIDLQNRALRRVPAVAAACFLTAIAGQVQAAEVQVIIPGEIARNLSDWREGEHLPLISYGPARYELRQEPTHFRIELSVPFRALRPGPVPIPLFAAPLYLERSEIDAPAPDVARFVTASNQLSLYLGTPGEGTMHLSYRAPSEIREGKRRAQVPVLLGAAGTVRVETTRADLTILEGHLWQKESAEGKTVYEIGVAGQASLLLEWPEQPDSSTGTDQPRGAGNGLYGIGVTRAQNLTVITSDGSCTHFAEFDVQATAQEFSMQLPDQARLISVSMNGVELNSPPIQDQLCRVRLSEPTANQTTHRLSFRIAYPQTHLGFIGYLELALPTLFQTAGTTEWAVALPSGFETQVLASGLEVQSRSPDLSRFGDYGRILTSHAHLFLAKDLRPPGPVMLHLKYRQIIPAIHGSSAR